MQYTQTMKTFSIFSKYVFRDIIINQKPIVFYTRRIDACAVYGGNHNKIQRTRICFLLKQLASNNRVEVYIIPIWVQLPRRVFIGILYLKLSVSTILCIFISINIVYSDNILKIIIKTVPNFWRRRHISGRE